MWRARTQGPALSTECPPPPRAPPPGLRAGPAPKAPPPVLSAGPTPKAPPLNMSEPRPVITSTLLVHVGDADITALTAQS